MTTGNSSYAYGDRQEVVSGINALITALARGAILSAAIVAFVLSSTAEAKIWGLEDREYFDPHIAGPREATVKILFPASSPAFPYAQTEGRRLVWDISLGKEIPLIGYETSSSKYNSLGKGDWGCGLWLPVGFHMIEDLNGDDSSPILDTDYRFGLMLKGRFTLADQFWLKLRASVGHESTHVGDEFSLAAQRAEPRTFTRINVSHEDWDFTAGLDFILSEKHEIHVLLGLVGLVRPSHGYYSTDLLETNGAVVPVSHNNLEPYLSAEYFFLKSMLGTWAPWVSLDLRYRSVYDYTRADASIPEERNISTNFLVGLRNQERKRGEKGAVDVYLRVYYGVNPAGQFRSQDGYLLYGFGIHVPI